MNIYISTQKKLLEYSETKYKDFTSSLIPNCPNILGVRLPKIRKLVKQICASDWQQYISYTPQFMEEALLQGIIIAQKAKTAKDFKMIEQFIPKITNWAICDTFCNDLKFINHYKNETLKFLQQYLTSQKEFEIRFSFVILLNYFVEEQYLSKIYNILDNFSSNKYYAQMAAAWLLSICYIKYPNETLSYLKTSSLDKITYNKSIQKIIESKKVDKSFHDSIKKLKK